MASTLWAEISMIRLREKEMVELKLIHEYNNVSKGM
jgi:hypothetical protein